MTAPLREVRRALSGDATALGLGARYRDHFEWACPASLPNGRPCHRTLRLGGRQLQRALFSGLTEINISRTP